MAGEKGKPRKRKQVTEPDDKAQSARFVQAAKELGVDESGAAFKRALDTLIKPKKPKRKA